MTSMRQRRRGLRLLAVGLLAWPLAALAADGLEQALQAAQTHNPEVRSKLAELESLGYRVDEAQTARYPTFSVEAHTMNESGNKGLARVQQPLWSFGRISGNVALAERRQDAARYELLDIRRRLIEETAVAYALSRSLRQRIEVARANVAEHDDLLQMITRRRGGGVAADADVRLAASRLTQARSQLASLEAQLRKSLQDLYALTRVDIDAELPVPDAVAEPAGRPASWLETGHAKLLLQRARADIVEAETTVRRAELMPTISARVDRDIHGAGDNGSRTRAGIVLEGRLEGGGLAGYRRLQSESSRLRAAMEDIDTARKEAQRRLESLQVDMTVQRDLIAAQQAVADSVGATLESFLRQYDAGRKSWVDVLNTQRELADARQQLEQNRAAWLEAALRTAAITGRLDTTAGLEPSP